jgi:hypothetical protein
LDENRLNGATIGLPLGALPPPGLYTGLETAYLGVANPNGQGHSVGNQCVGVGGGNCANLPAIAQAVPLLWVPGWSFWGATYSASVVQAFYVYTTCGATAASGTSGKLYWRLSDHSRQRVCVRRSGACSASNGDRRKPSHCYLSKSGHLSLQCLSPRPRE